MTHTTDRLFITCHQCGDEVAGEEVAHDEKIPPSVEIRWHEKAIAHVRREHLRKRKEVQP